MSTCLQLPRISGSPTHTPFRRGFTLVELLLTVTLLLLIATALVVNFNPIRHGASLDEGVSRLETLIRFSRAEAANRGRTVRLEFQPAATNAPEPSAESVRLCWEPDPLGAPGTFEELPRALWDSDLDDWIDIVAVRPMPGQSPVDNSNANATPDSSTTDSIAPAATASSSKSSSSPTASPPAVISFYPDGSSDSAEVIVNSKEKNDDHREYSVRLMGATGWIYHQPVTNDLETPDPETQGDQVAEDPF